MKGRYTEHDKNFLSQLTILLVAALLLLAGLVIIVVFVVGKAFSGHASDESASTISTKGQIVVPDVCPAKLNDFTPEDFSYDGDYLACTAQPYERGVDVSHYQGEIDWQQVKAAGFTFAIIRVGGRGYGEEGRL